MCLGAWRSGGNGEVARGLGRWSGQGEASGKMLVGESFLDIC
jgi:hypothetical protein